MHNLLAIETSEETCSAALQSGGDCTELFESEPRKHSELILPMIDRLMAEAGLSRSSLDAVAFSRGPGSFTGVRIATAVAQGIGFALDIPVVPVSTLQALAQGAFRQAGAGSVLVALDARMQELYWGAFRLHDGLMQPAGEEMVVAPSGVPSPDGTGWTAAGSGWAAHADLLGQRLGQHVSAILPDTACHARDVATIAAALLSESSDYPVFEAMPVYLRNRVTHQKR
ncbi:MAG: tRNA (adenosine(37)-N6)-threonylcarbamoyltransferase complex dimerization subunit type 1 TsaB [Sedimenticolaceae bacterium]|nr:tRNA (adenosine(37)-N6)-threonylcarbamoyltransferase complex dimerization subunit type 1 TsaB [Sedimenticolaceae bacterium]